ncbi:MAG: hypothetical protein H6737_20860 [Alphaproteobacteria bacterium]|nr:hypothetical protein [Alphaproteobacteria bacterium]
MNEQQQAELLAAWLEDPKGPPPDGLDADVVESLVALRPELAPAPRVTVDDILAGITEGPLAVAPAAAPMPVGASIGAAPEDAPVAGSSKRRRPWWIAAVGIGGFSSLVAAAALLLVVGSVTMNSGSPVARQEAPATRDADGVAVVDTGAGAGEGRARPAKPRPSMAYRPSPAPRPAPASAPLPAEPEAEPDAVALGEDFDDSVDMPAGAKDLDPDAGRLREPIPELAAKTPTQEPMEAPPRPEEAKKAEESARMTADVDGGEGQREDALSVGGVAQSSPAKGAPAPKPAMSRPAPSAPMMRPDPTPAAAPPPPPVAAPITPSDDAYGAAEEDALADDAPMSVESSRSYEFRPGRDALEKEERRQKKKDSAGGGGRKASSAPSVDAEGGMAMDAEPTATAAEPETKAMVPAGVPLATQARHGVSGTHTPEIDEAIARLAAGDPGGALAVVETALAANPGNTLVRQYLLVLKGDALTRLGDAAGARTAYQQAVDLAASR